MIDFDQAYAAIKSRAYGVWPQTVLANGGGGIMEAEHHEMIPWDREVLPYGAIIIDPTVNQALTMDALDFEQVVDVYYVDFVKGGSTGIRQALQALIQDLYPDPPTPIVEMDYGEVMDVIGYSTARTLYPNYFFRSRNSMHRAGMMQFKYLVG